MASIVDERLTPKKRGLPTKASWPTLFQIPVICRWGSRSVHSLVFGRPPPPVRHGGTPRYVAEIGPKGVHTRLPRGARVGADYPGRPTYHYPAPPFTGRASRWIPPRPVYSPQTDARMPSHEGFRLRS